MNKRKVAAAACAALAAITIGLAGPTTAATDVDTPAVHHGQVHGTNPTGNTSPADTPVHAVESDAAIAQPPQRLGPVDQCRMPGKRERVRAGYAATMGSPACH